MQNDGQDTKAPRQNYVEKLQEDFYAKADAYTSNDVISTIDSQRRAIQASMEQADAQLSQLIANPALIQVPEDAHINPLRAIGAGLRAIGGDSSSLDSLLDAKERVKARQQAIVTQNAVIQNEYMQAQRESILNQLSRDQARLSSLELARAEAIEAEARDLEEQELYSLLGSFSLLESGYMSAEEFFANDKNMAFLSKYRPGFTRGSIIAMADAGQIKRRREELLANPQKDPEKPRTPAQWEQQPLFQFTKNMTDKDLKDSPENMAIARQMYAQQYGIPEEQMDRITDEMILAQVRDEREQLLSQGTITTLRRASETTRTNLSVAAGALGSDFSDKLKSLPVEKRTELIAAVTSGTLTQDMVDEIASILGDKMDDRVRSKVIGSQERATLREVLSKAVNWSDAYQGYQSDLAGSNESSISAGLNRMFGGN